MVSRCETSLILVLSQGFKNKLFFEVLFPFVMRISVLQFGAASSFWKRTEPGSLWSPSLLLGWLGSSWRMNVLPGQPLCCFSCTPSREWETKDVLRAPAEHSCPAEWSYFWIFFCLKYPLCHFPTFIHMYVNRLAFLCVFQCSNPNCYWSPPSQCSVALQFVLLLTMFNKYVN